MQSATGTVDCESTSCWTVVSSNWPTVGRSPLVSPALYFTNSDG